MSYSPVLGRFIQRDPLGYVDGMDNYQYVKSQPERSVDPSGMAWSLWRFLARYWYGLGGAVDLKETGNFDEWHSAISSQLYPGIEKQISSRLTAGNCGEKRTISGSGSQSVSAPAGRSGYAIPESWMYVMGGSTVSYTYKCTYTTVCEKCCDGTEKPKRLDVSCDLQMKLRDWFENPLDIGGTMYSSRIAGPARSECEHACQDCYREELRAIERTIPPGTSPNIRWREFDDALQRYNRCLSNCDARYPESELPGATAYQINADWTKTVDFSVELDGCK